MKIISLRAWLLSCGLVASALAVVATACSKSDAGGSPDPVATTDSATTPDPHTPVAGGDGARDSDTDSSNAGGKKCAKVAPTGHSGVEGGKQVRQFDDGDREKFCAWAQALYGGYGCVADCPSGFEASFYPDLPSCKANLNRPKCAATASDVEACFQKDAEDLCALAVFDAPECAAWNTCMQL